MSKINPESRSEIFREEDKEDQLARERLLETARPMEQRIDADYREHVNDLLEDMQKDYDLEDINAYEQGEYCVILKNRATGNLKSYGFESPLSVILPPKNPENPNNLAERQTALYNYLFQITLKE